MMPDLFSWFGLASACIVAGIVLWLVLLESACRQKFVVVEQHQVDLAKSQSETATQVKSLMLRFASPPLFSEVANRDTPVTSKPEVGFAGLRNRCMVCKAIGPADFGPCMFCGEPAGSRSEHVLWCWQCDGWSVMAIDPKGHPACQKCLTAELHSTPSGATACDGCGALAVDRYQGTRCAHCGGTFRFDLERRAHG